MRGVVVGVYDMVKKVSYVGVENFCLFGGNNLYVFSFVVLSKWGSCSC